MTIKISVVLICIISFLFLQEYFYVELILNQDGFKRINISQND